MAVIHVPCASACAAIAWASSGSPAPVVRDPAHPARQLVEVNSPARTGWAATTNSTVVCQCESSTTTVS